MLLIYILLVFVDSLKSRMFENYTRTLTMIQSLKIKRLAWALLVSAFDNYLWSFLIAAHTANNVDFGDGEDHENEGYESKGP